MGRQRAGEGRLLAYGWVEERDAGYWVIWVEKLVKR